MKLACENLEDVFSPSKEKIKSTILKLRSYGSHSFASLTNDDGDYVQVAGGGVTCMVERFVNGKRERAFHGKPSPVFPDGTILSFRAGNIPMRSDEWFAAAAVVDIFECFLLRNDFPEGVNWRPAPGF